MNNDLISRQDALKPFCIAPDGTRIPEVDCNNFPVEFSVEFIKKHLLSLPSAQPKMGKWLDANGKEVEMRNGVPTESCWCSRCKDWLVASDEYYVRGYFCPNCGADMRGVNDVLECDS